jgi:predicted acetyltransferase
MELKLLEYVHENLPKGFTPYYLYSMIVDSQEVGRIVLRVGSDEEHYYDGHIGYTVFEEFRGHNYAYQGCLLLKEMIHFDHLIITCDPHHFISQKIIKKLGCQYIETKAIPQHLRKFYQPDEIEKMIYLWQ